MVASAWLIGSVYLDAFNIEVNAVNKAISAGYYYLRHTTTLLSLIDTLEDAVQTEAAGATWRITEGRRARLVPQAAQPVSIDWLSATNVRDLLGYTGNKASNDSPYEATNCSTLLWSPGWPAIPDTVIGTEGRITNDLTLFVSADGTTSLTDRYYEQVWQDLAWTEILAERMRVDAATAGGGTFHEFHETCLKPGWSCRYYQEQDETDGSTTEVTWDDSSTNSFGPYRIRTVDPGWYRRVVPNADLYSPMDLPLMKVNEYS